VFFYQIQNKNVPATYGDLGVIYDRDNRFLAVGLYDPFSDIRLRILNTKRPTEIDLGFFRERLEKALAIRAPLAETGTTGYRVLNGENDGFPGFVIDRYDSTVVLKLYTAAWFPYLEGLLTLIREKLAPERGVLLMSRHVQRTLPPAEHWRNADMLFGEPLQGPVRFQENGLWFEADVLQGQKTGFFLDQRENRLRIQKLSAGKTLLNVFSYTGGFSIYAFAGGARSVVEVDSNRHALEAARANLKLNFPDQAEDATVFRQVSADAFEEFARMEERNETFDIVILDPPAFAKNKAHKRNALLAYTRLAKAGAKRTKPGGLLFAASCSAPVEAWEFYRAVDLGIRNAGRTYEEIERTGHAIDHPVAFREGAYLKGIYCRVG
jgi:23S rRNA (cytosine1962-C5)-methyltransferase